jgi:hypothetical protein
LRGVDEAIRRRFHLVPFNVTIPPEERDKDLANKLRAEWPGILNWAIEGCLKWQAEGLGVIFLPLILISAHHLCMRLCQRDAFEAALVVRSNTAIKAVLRPGCPPQITPPIIGSVRIDMINVGLRPRTSHPQPGKRVGLVVAVIDCDTSISIRIDTSRHNASTDMLCRPTPPSEHPRLWVVV